MTPDPFSSMQMAELKYNEWRSYIMKNKHFKFNSINRKKNNYNPKRREKERAVTKYPYVLQCVFSKEPNCCKLERIFIKKDKKEILNYDKQILLEEMTQLKNKLNVFMNVNVDCPRKIVDNVSPVSIPLKDCFVTMCRVPNNIKMNLTNKRIRNVDEISKESSKKKLRISSMNYDDSADVRYSLNSNSFSCTSGTQNESTSSLKSDQSDSDWEIVKKKNIGINKIVLKRRSLTFQDDSNELRSNQNVSNVLSYQYDETESKTCNFTPKKSVMNPSYFMDFIILLRKEITKFVNVLQKEINNWKNGFTNKLKPCSVVITRSQLVEDMLLKKDKWNHDKDVIVDIPNGVLKRINKNYSTINNKQSSKSTNDCKNFEQNFYKDIKLLGESNVIKIDINTIFKLFKQETTNNIEDNSVITKRNLINLINSLLPTRQINCTLINNELNEDIKNIISTVIHVPIKPNNVQSDFNEITIDDTKPVCYVPVVTKSRKKSKKRSKKALRKKRDRDFVKITTVALVHASNDGESIISNKYQSIVDQNENYFLIKNENQCLQYSKQNNYVKTMNKNHLKVLTNSNIDLKNDNVKNTSNKLKCKNIKKNKISKIDSHVTESSDKACLRDIAEDIDTQPYVKLTKNDNLSALVNDKGAKSKETMINQQIGIEKDKIDLHKRIPYVNLNKVSLDCYKLKVRKLRNAEIVSSPISIKGRKFNSIKVSTK